MFLLNPTGLCARLAAPVLLLLPALVSVQLAIGFADQTSAVLEHLLQHLAAVLHHLPDPLRTMLIGSYGVISMLPFLVLYALPTLLIFSVLVWALKDSGLLSYIGYLLDPWLFRLGLSSQSILPVVMGFGCNVPAIMQTRELQSCERCSTTSAICFGSACSYQLPATLAVFGAAGMGYLTLPYLLLLLSTTAIYLRYALPHQSRSQPLIYRSGSFHWPRLHNLWPSITSSLNDFIRVALPIFIVICLFAGLLDWTGTIVWLTSMAKPLMAAFNLPPESATSVLMGAVRKDGIAIGLLAPGSEGLKISDISALQLLTLTYLAGTLLPCLVTVCTLIREFRFRQSVKILSRQALWAAGFTLVLAWGGRLMGAIIL